MTELFFVLRVVHIINAILMAWPFYALVSVNQRARLGPPLGDRADTFIENIIKNRTIPCFVFQGTALATGLALVLLRGEGLQPLLASAALLAKFVMLLLIAGLLSYVHVSVQPRIDALFAKGGSPVEKEVASQIGTLRSRRKGIAAVCLLVVLTSAMLGVQGWVPFPGWLTAVMMFAIVLFTWRAYTSVTPYGWM
ncbi:MAG: hypothetical protein ACE5HZ_08090 [Fidelibacterota bacterium]